MEKHDLSSFDVLGKRYELPYTEGANRTKEHILIESTVLFAMKGYAAVSMRDIAQKVGITPAALYNHFANKDNLWEDVLDHSIRLFRLYHENLDEELEKADSFEEILRILFDEPSKMKNAFTCFGFGLIMKEQFRDARAGKFFREVFIEFTEGFAKKWFDSAVDRGLAPPFDTKTVAASFVHSVMICIDLRVQELMNPEVNFEISAYFDGLRHFFLKAAGCA
ncbi:MAG: TetR/AcrR family transcriptional regulator [Synergistaceae bacterium]|jgi:AcrR family transcriptional regulator|nr:TetR/AcrR family transcriptional regulator [Synergistaceae bacterium]